MQRIPALDGLRAVAILAVMGYHLSLEPLKGGFLGVDLFFVLSGFLITSLLVQEENLKRFYARRALRILPPLVAAVALAAALNPVKPEAIAAGLFFYANFLKWETLGAVAHLWSLAIEEHFYLVWPLAFMHAGRWRIPLLWAVIFGSVALRIVLLGYGVGNEEIHKCSILRADAIAVGCLLALRPTFWGWGGERLGMLSLAAIVACFALVTWPGFVLLSFGFTGFAALGALALTSMLRPEDSRVTRLLSMQVAQYIGRRSYGLYLYHWPLYQAVNATGLTVQWPATCVAAKVVLTFAVAELSFRTIERVADRLKAGLRPPALSAGAPSMSRE